jgi:hypothetical protein
MSLKLLSALSRDLDQAGTDTKERNVIIRAGTEPDVEEFLAHSLILRFRSRYFKKALDDAQVNLNVNGKLTILKLHIRPRIFEIVLK